MNKEKQIKDEDVFEGQEKLYEEMNSFDAFEEKQNKEEKNNGN